MVFDYLDGTATEAQVRAAAGGRNDIVDELVFEMREIMRGEGMARLVDLATACGGLDAERQRLRSRNPSTRAQGVRRLAIYGLDAVPLLQGALRDANPGVRTVAALELTALGAAPPLATLAELMRVGIDAQAEDLR